MKETQKQGFTVIEILVVVAIIGVLSAVVLANLHSARTKAEIAKAEAQLDGFAKGIVLLANETAEWPGHNAVATIGSGAGGNEVWDLASPEAGLIATDGFYSNWAGPYMTGSTTDPWGNPYFFDDDYDIGTTSSSSVWAVVIGSFGPNGTGQNVFDSDDVIRILLRP